jgi:hypothetical protein
LRKKLGNSPIKINIISDVSPEVWKKQISTNPDNGIELIFSNEPENADYYLVYGKYLNHTFKTSKEKVWFYCSEPPEIHKFRKSYLKQFGTVFAPEFSYLMKTPNWRKSFPVYPLHIGVKFKSDGEVVDTNFEILANLPNPNIHGISAIISNKVKTVMQRRRITFINLLAKVEDVNLELFGREINPVEDKLQVLSKFRYHIAIENAVHDGYFTEKIMDPVVSRNIVFYSGAPDINRYLNMDSVIRIDLADPASSILTIKKYLEDESCYENIQEALNYNSELILKNSSLSTIIREMLQNAIIYNGKGDIPAHLVANLSLKEKIHRLFVQKTSEKIKLLVNGI